MWTCLNWDSFIVVYHINLDNGYGYIVRQCKCQQLFPSCLYSMF